MIRQARPPRSGALAGDALIAGTVVARPLSVVELGLGGERRSDLDTVGHKDQWLVGTNWFIAVCTARAPREIAVEGRIVHRASFAVGHSWVISARPQMLRRKPSGTQGLRLMARRGLTRTVFV